MWRVAFSVATHIVLSAALLHAQALGSGSPPSASRMSGSNVVAGQTAGVRPSNSPFPVRPNEDQRFHRGRGFGGYWGPWYYPDLGWGLFAGDYVWDLPDYSDQQPVTATSPQVIVLENKDSRTPLAAVESPKLIEAPPSEAGAKSKGPSTVNNNSPATLFVLKNGERLESRSYLLTSQSLQIEVGREQRTVPISTLDIDSTIAANRQRGIELIVPRDSNTVFLSF